MSDPLVRRLRRIIDQRLIRREPEPDIRAGLTQLVTYTVQVSLAHSCHVRLGDDDVHPSSIRTGAGESLAFRTRWRGNTIDVVGIVSGLDEPETLQNLLPLPWERRERFEPRRPIDSTGSPHLLDHPERYGGSVSREDVCKAIWEAKELVTSRQVEISRYWYQPDTSWCFVVPLTIPNRNPLAAVVVSGRDSYDVVTALPLHETFWNVATVGLVPPSWLNGPPTELPLAA